MLYDDELPLLYVDGLKIKKNQFLDLIIKVFLYFIVILSKKR
jgi:hypothetical protein